VTGISVWRFLEIILVIILSGIKCFEGFECGYNLFVPSARIINNFDKFLSLFKLKFVLEKNCRAIRRSSIIPLLIQSCWVMNTKEIIKNGRIIYFISFVGDFERFSVSWMISIRRILIFSSYISYLSIDNSWKCPKELFHSPETSSGKIGFL